jgi:hypothetical protein
VTTYLVDCFERYSASALAAMMVTRSVLGCAFSLVGVELYRRLGFQWGTLLLVILCIAMAPLPTAFYWWGPKLRSGSVVV